MPRPITALTPAIETPTKGRPDRNGVTYEEYLLPLLQMGLSAAKQRWWYCERVTGQNPHRAGTIRNRG